MTDIFIWLIIAMIAVYCVYREVSDHKKGIACDCNNDCTNCRIQCRSNEKYYGLSGKGKESHVS